MDFAAFDWTLYWFMFPVAILVATSAMLSGIGGAAIFAPIFLIIFPLLGSEYPLASLAAAIGVALFTEVFGFSSGFVGYYRKGLIDFKSAIPFITSHQSCIDLYHKLAANSTNRRHEPICS